MSAGVMRKQQVHRQFPNGNTLDEKSVGKISEEKVTKGNPVVCGYNGVCWKINEQSRKKQNEMDFGIT